jgi:RsiW-degrading membrane proteinase PrsW (M82 family)
VEISLSQTIGIVSVGVAIIMALGVLWYANQRASYIYRRSIRTTVTWVIIGLVVQTVLLLAIANG